MQDALDEARCEPVRSRSSADGWFEWLPSGGWAALMLVPTVVQLPGTGSGASRDQLVASSAILLLLLASDAAAWLRLRRMPVRFASDRRPSLGKGWVIALAAVVIVSTGLSVATMPQIPVLVALSGQPGAPGAYSEAREAAIKLGVTAPWLGPVCAISVSLLAPVAVLSMWSLRWRIAAIGLAAWAIAYGLSTTAWFPSILLAFGLVIGWSAASPRMSGIARAAAAVGVLVAAASLVTVVAAPSPMFMPEVVERSRDRAFVLDSGDSSYPASIADRHRVWSATPIDRRPEAGPVVRRLDRLLYRAFFTPADVSIRWYQYFRPTERRLGLLSVVDRPPDAARPSRAIGLWAYRDRFPTLYLDSVNAYASLDADAYARAGLPAALAAGVGLALARVSLLGLQGRSTVARIGYGVGIALLLLLPAQASLQAILVIHGLGVLACASAYVAFKAWRVRARNRRTAAA